MLAVIHGIEKLVFVDEAPQYKVNQPKKEHEPGAGKNAVYCTDYKYQDSLRQVISIAEDRWLY